MGCDGANRNRLLRGSSKVATRKMATRSRRQGRLGLNLAAVAALTPAFVAFALVEIISGLPEVGDRKGIEEQTKLWDKTIVNRRAGMSGWVDYRYQTMRRGIKVYAYANNHYAGYAPATVALFLELWEKQKQNS
jgi:hypothetical protein